MRFPERELEVIQLGQDMSRGLTANPETFPAPPTSVEEIDEALAAYTAAREASVVAQAQAQKGTTAKNDALEALTTKLRFNLRYVESVAKGDPGTLQLVGWGGRRRPIRNEQIVPGQVATLDVRQEGPDWLTLAWQEPFEGGTVAAYRVQRRRENGGWVDVGMSVDTAVKLDHQEAGVELVFQVIGTNAAGEGPASNIVRVVL